MRIDTAALALLSLVLPAAASTAELPLEIGAEELEFVAGEGEEERSDGGGEVP